MPPYDFTQEDSATIGSTEYSLPNDGTVLTPQTDVCQMQVWINVLALAAGDEFVVKLYEKVIAAGTQIKVEEWRLNLHHSRLMLPALIVHNGWDVTIQKVSGTDRVVEWSLRKVT